MPAHARVREASPKGREVAGIILLAFGLFLVCSLLSLQAGDGSLMGPLGRLCARLAYGAFGLGGHLLCAALVLTAVRLLAGRRPLTGLVEGTGAALGLVSLAVVLHLCAKSYRVDGFGPGGLLGEYAAEVLRAAVSTAGTALIAVVGLLVALVATTPLTTADVVRAARRPAGALVRGARFVVVEVARFVAEVLGAMLPGHGEEGGEAEPDEPAFAQRKTKTGAAPEGTMDGDTVRTDEPAGASEKPKRTRPEPKAVPAEPAGPVIFAPSFQKARESEMREKEKQVSEARPDFIPLGDGVYRLPAVSLLRYDDTEVNQDRGAMLELSARLVQTLGEYGVNGEVTEIHPGPVVTMYEFAPAPGTRVSKIRDLADDLALRLEAVSVRITSLPGKAAIGIEVPNKQRETVFLKEILADDVFQKAKSKLTLALGKDIKGRPVAVDLAKMPHLLVAGTTGAGKSVGLNAMITSVLYNATPEEVRLIMVDPKMLELNVYEGVPHLLLPVVTDPKKANLALRWAVEEMERRYELLAEACVRDIVSFNRKLERPDKVDGVMDELKRLPYIVIVIDEFADLMMVAPKDVETSVARLAQKARAAGIHLVLATQRPSVDVITGLIKANFPSRIAFKVVQKNDSRTIIDQNGAEALLGQGDMLFMDRGGELRRVHGCLVQDDEVNAVAEFLKKQGKPVYDLDILKPRDEEGSEEPADEGLSDEMYDRAVALVAESRQASISMIQRRLRVGYNRAARMVERMEREGIVGPADGPNRREVLIQPTA